MKVLGISLEGSTAIFSGLEEKNNGIIDISDNFRKVALKDHLDSQEIKSLCAAIHSYLDSNQFDKIGIIKRGKKGLLLLHLFLSKSKGLFNCTKIKT